MDNRLKKGKLLKQTRESKGISLHTVHEATKIPMDSLRAIEEGYKVRTLSDFYYRSFTKQYANYLGVDPSLLLDDDFKQKIREPEDLKAQEKSESIFPKISFSMPFSVSPDVRRMIIKVVLGSVILFFLLRVVGCLLRRPSDPEKTKTERSEIVATTQKVPEKQPQSKGEQTIPQVTPAVKEKTFDVTATREHAKKVTIVVRAKKRTWLQVRVDGQVVFRSTLDRGVVETWQASEEIELSISNINDIDLEFNGRILDSLGSATRGPKKILLTPSGFKISD